MTAIVRRPLDRIARFTAGGVCRDVRSATGLGFLGASHGRATVVFNEAIAQSPATGDGESAVADTVNAKVGDRIVAAVAARQDAAGNNGDGAEVFGTRAGNGIGHRGAVRETYRKALVLVDAQAGINVLVHGVDELDTLAAGVGPAVSDSLRRHEDGRFIGFHLQAKVGPRQAGSAAACHLVHGSAYPV